jgi:SHS2 domain-containing protein
MRQPPRGARPLFREIDHTGDRAIVIEAKDETALFEKAALALFAIMVSPDGIELREDRTVVVTGTGWADVLQRWLAELLVLFSADGFVVGEVVVEGARPEEVRGRVRGESFDPRRHELYGEVKAVTYHELAVTQSGTGWRARVIFDV